jgi:hypothetical protein
VDTLSKFTLPGGLFILTLVFGFWLSQVGKPYNYILFNIHKLLALGAVIVAGIRVVGLLKQADLLTLLILLSIVVVLCIVALFASGALMSMGKLDYILMLTIHRLALVVLVILITLVFYLSGRCL